MLGGVIIARTVNLKEFEEKKRRIISESVKLISSNGYKDFSINQVIDRCKISKSSFFHHFKSRDNLIEAIVDLIMKPINSAYVAIVNNSEFSARQKINRLFEVAVEIKTEENLPFVKMIQLIYSKENSELYHHLLDRTFNECNQYFTDIISEGCKNGEFDILFPTGTARMFMRLILNMNEQIGRTVLCDSENKEDWSLLYQELQAFENLAVSLFNLDITEPLYGLKLHSQIRNKIEKLEE